MIHEILREYGVASIREIITRDESIQMLMLYLSGGLLRTCQCYPERRLVKGCSPTLMNYVCASEYNVSVPHRVLTGLILEIACYIAAVQ